MKKLFSVILLVAVMTLCLIAIAFGADPVAVEPAAGNLFTGILAWVMGHEVVLGAAVVAVLDLVFAMNSKSASNGALHFLYVLAQKSKNRGAV
jgi:hypothetical protein